MPIYVCEGILSFLAEKLLEPLRASSCGFWLEHCGHICLFIVDVKSNRNRISHNLGKENVAGIESEKIA